MEFVDYNGNDITNIIIQPNDNLLINSDFRNGIINQKGLNSYTCDNNQRLYTIDSWYINCENSTVIVNNGYITVDLKGNDFGQAVHSLNKNTLEYLTATIKFKDQDLKIIKINTTNLEIEKDYFFDINSNFKLGIFFWGTSNSAWFYIQGNGVFNLEYIKLEEGIEYTGMPTWNEAEELNKCKYYFERINVKSWGYFTSAYVITRTNTAEFPYKFSKKK